MKKSLLNRLNKLQPVNDMERMFIEACSQNKITSEELEYVQSLDDIPLIPRLLMGDKRDWPEEFERICIKAGYVSKIIWI